MDLSRLSRGEQIAAGSGALLFVFMFFKWFGISVETGIGSVGGSWNAWDSLEFIRFVLLITAAAAVGLVLLKASGNDLSIPVPASTIITLLGALSVLLILYRIIDPPGGGGFEGVSVGRQIGVFLGLLAAAGVAYGGYTAMEEEGTTFQDAADSFSSGPGGPPPTGGGGQSPPPSGQ